MNTLQRIGIGAAALLLAIGLLAPQSSEASHFRFARLSWVADGNGEVEFTLVAAWRRDAPSFSCVNFGPGDGTCDGSDGYPITGDVIIENQGDTEFTFGDGTSTGTLRFEVIDHSVSGNWIVAVALDPDSETQGIEHDYGSNSGPITAFMQDYARIGNLNNRESVDYRVETLVFPQSTNGSPTTSLSPIVNVEEDVNEATFTVPAADDEGDDLRFRVATEQEATDGEGNGGVPSFSIDSNTGEVTINTNNLGGSEDFWTEQVMIEELDDNGNVRTKTPVDFLIQEVPQIGNPPEVTISKSCPISVQPGNTATFDVTATDPDDNESLDLNLSSALPQGASMDPPLPIDDESPPITSTFMWTPDQSQVGQSEVLNYTAQDKDNQQGQASCTVEVVPQASCDMPTLAEDDIDQDNRTLSNTMQDDEGVAEFTFTTLDNFTVVDNFDSGYDASDSDGDTKLDTWTWNGSGGPPTSVDFTLKGGPDNTSTYFLDVTDDCEPSNTATFDPAYEFGPAASRTQLAGNAPNPFSGQTTVEFDLAEQSRVTVAVYDMMGRKVATLVDGVRSAGSHAVGWNGQSDSGQDLASGVYLLRMQAEGKSETKRTTIIR